jgi:hypothetical protein
VRKRRLLHLDREVPLWVTAGMSPATPRRLKALKNRTESLQRRRLPMLLGRL